MWTAILIGISLSVGAYNSKPVKKFDHKVVHVTKETGKKIGSWFKEQ